jgi:hypothetical protein
LGKARELAGNSAICKKTLVSGGEDGIFFLFPWMGSGGMRTVDALLKKPSLKKTLGIKSSDPENDIYFRIETKLKAGAKGSEDTFSAALAEASIKAGDDSKAILPIPQEIPFSGKYDYLLPHALLVKQYAANMLDINSLYDLGKSLKKDMGHM